MVKLLISVTLSGAMLVIGRTLLEGRAYSDLRVSSVAFFRKLSLIEAQIILEELRYIIFNLSALNRKEVILHYCKILLIIKSNEIPYASFSLHKLCQHRAFTFHTGKALSFSLPQNDN